MNRSIPVLRSIIALIAKIIAVARGKLILRATVAILNLKEIDWSKSMKQILITLVAVVLGITAMSSYAEGDHKERVGDNPVNVLSEGSKDGIPGRWSTGESNSDVSKERESRRLWVDEEPNSDVSDEGKNRYPTRVRASETSDENEEVRKLPLGPVAR